MKRALHFGFFLGMHPGSFRRFVEDHPELDVSTFPIDTQISDRHGRSVEVHPLDLEGATFTFEPCGDDVGTHRLGGIPPEPRSRCAFRYRLRTAEREQVVYVFRITGDHPVDSGYEHFKNWAVQTGTELNERMVGAAMTRSGGGVSRRWLTFRRDGHETQVRIVKRRYELTIYMPAEDRPGAE